MAIEEHPVTALGTYDEPTWAETPTVAPVAPSAPVAAAGLGSVPLVATLFNYLFRQPYRWIRALAHRTPRSDLGLISSYVQTGGVYPTAGGTLSVALPLTEVWVGGVLVQVADSGGSPHVFTASRDSYLFLDADGVRTETEVANGAPAPVGPGGTAVRVSKTVTDGTQVTASTLQLTDVPTLGAIGITALDVIGNLEVTGTLGVTGATTLGSTLEVSGNAIFSLNVEIGGDLDMAGNNIVNGGLLSSVTLATTGNASIGGSLDLTNGAISNVTTFGASGDSTFGAGVAITGGLSIGGSLAANGNVGLGSNGADTVTVNSPMIVAGAAGGSVASDPTATLEWNGAAEFAGRLNVATGTSTTEGDLSKDGSGYLRYRDASATRYAHTNASGWVKGHGQADTIAAAATVTLDTSASVAPLVSADLDVAASCWVSRAIAGTVTVSLDEVGGLGQIGTSGTFSVPITGAGSFAQINFSRVRSAATTTPRVFRLTVAGGGSNVTVQNARITVTPTS